MTRLLIVCGGAGSGLLGQGELLGFNGELQIDVEDETIPPMDRAHQRRLELDQAENNINQMQWYAYRQVNDPKYKGHPAHRRHANLLHEYDASNAPLKEGLSRTPALGGQAVRHHTTEGQLEALLEQLIPGGQDLEVWVVTSTSGGTGAGVYRYIVEHIAKYAYRHGANLNVVVNIVRIGPLTYRQIDTERVNLNTFFGLAADASLNARLQEGYAEEGRVAIALKRYYLEVPPTGADDTLSYRLRAQLVETAVKTLMLPELNDAINPIANNTMFGVVRVGFWGKDFSEDQLYFESLTGLIDQLENLLNENRYPKLHVDPAIKAPEYQPETWLQQLEKDTGTLKPILDSFRNGWRFRGIDARSFSDWARFDNALNSWIQNIEQLTGEDISARTHSAKARQTSIEIEPDKQATEAVLSITTPEQFDGLATDEQRFVELRRACYVIAWHEEFLGSEHSDLYARVVEQAEKCDKSSNSLDLLKNDQARVEELIQLLPEFVRLLGEAWTWRQLYVAARELLDHARFEFRLDAVYTYAADRRLEIGTSVRASEDALTIPADLWGLLDQLSGQSWYSRIRREVMQDNLDGFEREVISGAIGLTQSGLRFVLDQPKGADMRTIKQHLANHRGQMVIREQVHEAVWWNGVNPPGNPQTTYIIFPKLDPELAGELGAGDTANNITYIETKLGMVGLYVLAFEGVPVGSPNDDIQAPSHLCQYLTGVVTDLIEDDWDEPEYGRAGGRIKVVKAGSGFEPLYLDLLVNLGLSDQAIVRLGEYYELYTRNEKAQPYAKLLKSISDKKYS